MECRAGHDALNISRPHRLHRTAPRAPTRAGARARLLRPLLTTVYMRATHALKPSDLLVPSRFRTPMSLCASIDHSRPFAPPCATLRHVEPLSIPHATCVLCPLVDPACPFKQLTPLRFLRRRALLAPLAQRAICAPRARFPPLPPFPLLPSLFFPSPHLPSAPPSPPFAPFRPLPQASPAFSSPATVPARDPFCADFLL